MNLFKPIQLAKKLFFCTQFLSFSPSVAQLCNLKMSFTDYKIANFRCNSKSLNEFNGKLTKRKFISLYLLNVFIHNFVLDYARTDSMKNKTYHSY
jgi:hypothetical protein